MKELDTMYRRWIPIEKLSMFDEFHFETEDGWDVDVERDGKTKEEHQQGIEYLKGLIKKSAKIRPILVHNIWDEDKEYRLLDGFKRAMAHKESGERFVEAFVCTHTEVTNSVFVPYLHDEMRAEKGGQMKETFPKATEGYEQEDFNYETQEFLYKNPDKPHGIRIELAESIHCHWGDYGRYRLGMGRTDFLQLAEAISSIK